jgi:hypothetical protein
LKKGFILGDTTYSAPKEFRIKFTNTHFDSLIKEGFHLNTWVREVELNNTTVFGDGTTEAIGIVSVGQNNFLKINGYRGRFMKLLETRTHCVGLLFIWRWIIMAPKKTSVITVDISSGKVSGQIINYTTMDVNTATLSFQIIKQSIKYPLTDVTAKVFLNMEDGSQFVEDCDIVDSINGVVQYTLKSNEIKHSGRVDGEFYLIYSDSSVGSFNFTFYIKKSAIDTISVPAQEVVISDIETFKASLEARLDDTQATLTSVQQQVTNAQTQADNITTLINQNQVAKQSDLNATNASLAVVAIIRKLRLKT